MKHHTFVCGTSKSKEQDAYYVYHDGRFWGSLHKADITDSQIEPEDYRRLGKEYGIYLTEVVDPDQYRVAKDSEIKPHQVEAGMRNLVDKIQTHNPIRIAFVGKNAATWFYRYAENKDITHSQASGHTKDRRNLEGPKLDWDYLGLDYYMLTNTHRHWDKEIWMDFWDVCRSDVEAFTH